MNEEKNNKSSLEFENNDNKQVIDESKNNEIQSNDEDSNLQENIKLSKEIDLLKDKVLRISAEYDNYRKRTSKEKIELYGNACIDVITKFLPILDNLERASSTSSDLESLKTGIDMVIKLFHDVFEKLDVKEIDSTGEFNPNLHEAVMHISDKNLDSNVIVEVLQKGYIRNEKVLRHSMVKVAN